MVLIFDATMIDPPPALRQPLVMMVTAAVLTALP
eukprot:CAMPEP_0202462986 /NCGR_PEP_ID=MMETSP1360-20130828/56222_1 /ASSEMBLY_ACC=CAM_ASM_000848 /TAXON_ID=515479 /ORGANISM="Licmophora paradoxa, Strain CCMP2313" /LENGTH=33 /DNA_ID= /DNA_START= /DNA_END= /DNA_ORIENTATION=